jgi:hypothetical protein
MLAQAHDQLEGHFLDLSRERVPLGYPVYAFEHGLDDDRLDVVRKALCDDLLRTKRLKSEHWLLWTVVAAEIGYAYDGDEYWYSFESEIPEWISLGSREAVRNWFHDFTRRFNGFKPTGRWAEHFSIIAWPITHSILPRYLQAQFARHLYELRHELAAQEQAGVAELGRLLGGHYHGVSSRFENFLQQTALTARLVLALRDEDVQDVVTPIYKPTLARIVRDLELKSSSRSYLRDARHVLRDARTRAYARLAGSAPSSHSGPTEQAAASVPPGIKLIARRAADDSWTLGAALSDFGTLLAQAGISASVLDRTRLQFVDRPGSWMPGRALLSYARSTHALANLPANAKEPIIRFQRPCDELKPLLPYLSILTQPPWLLRLHGDGVARQVLGNHVRTGEDYILASSTPLPAGPSHALSLRPVACRTGGVVLYALHVPETASPAFIRSLQSLSLGYALRARVRPFGLVPRWDEAAGCSVWLVDEEVLLYLAADFHVSEFVVSINGAGRTHLPVTDEQETLVSLGLFAPGRYSVEITATAKKNESGANALRFVSPEMIALEVRAPVPWRSDPNARAGLRAVLQPSGASFDDLLAKRASLALHGPDGRTATVEARLYDVAGHVSTASAIGRLPLPSKDREVTVIVEMLSKEPLSERIQSAPRIDLAFAVEELGVAVVSFAHKVAPLRWKLAHASNDHIIRLVDEAGGATNISVNRYDITVPDQRIDVPTELCLKGVAVNAPGSLFVARFEDRVYAAFASVPPRGRVMDFSMLIPSATLSGPAESARNILRFLAILRLWRLGRPLGTLAVLRKNAILELIGTRIEQLACGARWAEKAHNYRRNGGRLDELQSDVGGSPGFASRMRTTEWTWHGDNAHARADFFRIAKTYGVCLGRGLCDLALRLAFDPTSIRLNDPAQGAREFEELGKLPILLRGAYFAKMTSDLQCKLSNDSTRSSP